MSQYYVTHPLLEPIKKIMEDDSYHDLVDLFLEGWQDTDGTKQYDRHFGVTSLMKSPRALQLSRRHKGEIKQDAANLLPMIRGTLVHEAIEQASAGIEGAMVEARFGEMFSHKTLVHHAIAYYHEERYVDWKNTSSVALGFDKFEWEAEVNYARYILERNGYPTKELYIGALVDDWRPSKVGRKGMPDEGVQLIPIKRWSDDQVVDYIEGLVQRHVKNENLEDDNIDDCTDEERWVREEGWKVWGFTAKGEPSKNALTSEKFKTDQEARAYAASVGKKVSRTFKFKTKPMKCMFYCEGAPFCNQYKKSFDTTTEHE